MTGCSDQEQGIESGCGESTSATALPVTSLPSFVFPCRAGEVMADNRSLRIAKLCVRGLQLPAVYAASEFAGINLRAAGMRYKDYVFICRRFDLVRHRGTRNVLSRARGRPIRLEIRREQPDLNHRKSLALVRGSHFCGSAQGGLLSKTAKSGAPWCVARSRKSQKRRTGMSDPHGRC